MHTYTHTQYCKKKTKTQKNLININNYRVEKMWKKKKKKFKIKNTKTKENKNESKYESFQIKLYAGLQICYKIRKKKIEEKKRKEKERKECTEQYNSNQIPQ